MSSAPVNPSAAPETRRADTVETLHGVEVPDPYRWLEDPDSDETKAWVEAQNAYSQAYLEETPGRDYLKRRLGELWDTVKFGVPRSRGGRLFFLRQDGLKDQHVLVCIEPGDEHERVILDPNTLSEDGTVSLQAWVPSEDGQQVAYALSTAGSDWQEVHVLDVASGLPTADHLRHVKFSGLSWRPDGSGFYYSRYAAPDPDQPAAAALYYQQLYFHRLGTDQSEDSLVYHRPDEKEWGFMGHVTDDGRYLVIHVWKGTHPKNQIFVQDLQQPEGEVLELLPGFTAEYSLVHNDGPTFYFKTDKDAPKGKLIALELNEPAEERWRTLVPESQDTLEGVGVVGGRLLLLYLSDAHSRVRIHSLDGTFERELELPGLGSAGGFSGRPEDPVTYFSFTSFTQPGAVYRHEIASGTTEVFRAPELKFDPAAYETRQVFATSKDGTKVPVFLTSKQDVPGGPRPTYLYAYGGFGVSVTPSYSVRWQTWLELGGILAVACLRGGGEYGEDWHQAGTFANKQNVFDDFAAVAEHLIAEGITSSAQLGIAGGSNGGLLVGASITQRPELFGAALPAVGVMDMLRFHKFTIGWAWISDYGDPDEAEAFGYLKAYSPLHNTKPGTTYPPTLVTTADHDDRVVPAHSHKFTAALQHAQGGPAPIMARIETKAGHGAGKPTHMILAEAADCLAFFARELGLDVPQA